MVKEKIPCPRCDESKPEPKCILCHGRGTLRTWHLLVTAGHLSGAEVVHRANLGEMPPGASVVDVSQAPLVLLRIERYHVSQAIVVACEALAGPHGEEPFVHRAW